MSKCSNQGDITANISNINSASLALGLEIGGICGEITNLGIDESIKNCYNEGNIEVEGSNNDYEFSIGGICGKSAAIIIESCYNIGSISTKELTINGGYSVNVGGITGVQYGQNVGTSHPAIIKYCYNTGSLQIGDSQIVGIICGNNNFEITTQGVSIPMGTNGQIENTYYTSPSTISAIGKNGDDATTYVESKDETAFKSGEVAWLLHNAGGNFGQGLDEDGNYINDENETPVLLAFEKNEGTEVYQLKLQVNNNDEKIIYRNSKESNLLSETDYNNLLNGAVDKDVIWKDDDGNVVVSGNRYTPTEDIALNATVDYVHNIYTKIIPDGAGDITVKGSAAEGETISFTVTANKGYEFVSVAGAAFTKGEEAGSYTFTMPAEDVVITATFKAIETGGDDDDEGGISTKRYQLFLANQDFYLNDEYDAEGLVLYSLHDKRYTKAGSSFTVWFEKNGEVNEGARVFISNRANGEYKEVKLDKVSGYYQIRNVQSNIYVKLYTEEGFPVAIEAIEATEARAYAQANKIVVVTPEPTEVQIISMAGAVVATAQVAGQQEFANLTEGVYIVRMGESVVKLQVRN